MTARKNRASPVQAILDQIKQLSDQERRELCRQLDRQPHLTPGYAVLPTKFLDIIDSVQDTLADQLKQLIGLAFEMGIRLSRRSDTVEQETEEAERLHKEEGLKWAAVSKRMGVKLSTLMHRRARYRKKLGR
jgi:DNA-directed RNA polymerase specialized sigma24 family protein